MAPSMEPAPRPSLFNLAKFIEVSPLILLL
jgi:hypothetical protein